MSDNAEMFKGVNENYECASITFGSSIGTGYSDAITTVAFTTSSNISVSGVTVSKAYYKATASGTYAARLGTSSANGSVTFNFSSAITIKSARVYAAAWDSGATLSVATDSTTADPQTISETTAPTIVDTATGGGKYYSYTLDSSGTTTSSFKISSVDRAYVLKIVLCISGGSSTTQTLSSSLSAVSLAAGENNSSISLTPSGFSGTPTYTCVATDSTICSASVTGTTLTINGLKAGSTTLTITATSGSETASTTVDVTVTAPAGAHLTLDNTTLSLTAERDSGSIQATSHSFSGTVTYSASSSSTSVATVSINSTSGLATVTPVAAGSSTITITASNGVDSDISATCTVTVSALPTPTVTLSSSSLTISTTSAGTITASATGFDSDSGVTYTAVSSNTAAVTASVTNNVITLTGKSVGSATITVTGSYTDTYGTQTDSATCAVTVSSYTGSTTQYTYYRIAPVTSSGTTANVYSVVWNSSSSQYVATVAKTLTKGTYYTTYQDVAEYWVAFSAMPANYMCADGDSSSGYSTTKNKAYTAYGQSARLWFTYHRTTGYMQQVPVYNTYGDGSNEATYYEIDISSSWSSYSSNRGALRNMAMPYGVTAYGVGPVIFYTGDHYSSFIEYYNYDGGWGPSFTGRSDYTAPTTITY
jgi:hypothetical protein